MIAHFYYAHRTFHLFVSVSQGYDSKEKRSALRKRGIRPQLPKQNYKTKKNLGRPIKISVPRFRTKSDVSPGIKENIAVWLFDGNAKKLIFGLQCNYCFFV